MKGGDLASILEGTCHAAARDRGEARRVPSCDRARSSAPLPGRSVPCCRLTPRSQRHRNVVTSLCLTLVQVYRQCRHQDPWGRQSGQGDRVAADGEADRRRGISEQNAGVSFPEDGDLRKVTIRPWVHDDHSQAGGMMWLEIQSRYTRGSGAGAVPVGTQVRTTTPLLNLVVPVSLS